MVIQVLFESITYLYKSWNIHSKSCNTGPLGTDIVYQSLIDIDTIYPCIITMTSGGSTQTAVGTLYDIGGPNGNYFDDNDNR